MREFDFAKCQGQFFRGPHKRRGLCASEVTVIVVDVDGGGIQCGTLIQSVGRSSLISDLAIVADQVGSCV